MIGIDIDVRSDSAEGEEAEVFVRAQGEPILSSENPALAIAYKIEAAYSLLRDIESDFGMLSIELREDNNRIICEALQRRVKSCTDELEANLTEHFASNSVLETFGYMWSKDYKETLFLPAFRTAVIEAGDGDDLISQEILDGELALLKKANGITETLDGEVSELKCSVLPQGEMKMNQELSIESLKQALAERERLDPDAPKVIVMSESMVKNLDLPVQRRARQCNMHSDCDAVDLRRYAEGRERAVHCHDEDCEDCYGK